MKLRSRDVVVRGAVGGPGGDWWPSTRPGRARPSSTTCPLSALKSAKQAGGDHALALDDRARTRPTLQGLTDKFNSSQSDVKVNLVNQIDYEETFQKYKAGLGSGDLPDIVQLQETDQQQMIDTQTRRCRRACARRPTSTASPTSCPG